MTGVPQQIYTRASDSAEGGYVTSGVTVVRVVPPFASSAAARFHKFQRALSGKTQESRDLALPNERRNAIYK